MGLSGGAAGRDAAGARRPPRARLAVGNRGNPVAGEPGVLGDRGRGRASDYPAKRAFRCLWLQILLDLALLTVVIHYVGSLSTYAPFMYLFHIVLACIFFPPRQGLAVTASAMGMLLVCVAVEAAGWAPARSVLAGLPGGDRGALPPAALARQLGFVGFISGTVWYLASRLAGTAQARSRAGRDQSPLGGSHRGARRASAPHDTPIESPLRRDSRQHTASFGRVLRSRRAPRGGGDGADFRALRDALAGDQGDATTGQPAVNGAKPAAAGGLGSGGARAAPVRRASGQRRPGGASPSTSSCRRPWSAPSRTTW